MKKKAALEMSIGTIVIIVIAVTMLIMGIVFVRSIMCVAIGLTGDMNNKIKGELNKLFGATGGEVQCIGAGEEPIKMIPGKTNIVYCLIKAPKTAKYSIELTNYEGAAEKSVIKNWIFTSSLEENIAPGDDNPKKAIRLNIPENAPEGSLILHLEVKKEGQLIASPTLDFDISRVGFLKATMC